MSCAPCAAKAKSQAATNNAYIKLDTPQPEDCNITKDILDKYLAVIKCLREKGLGMQFGLSSFNLNQLQGVVQSALNYPDNYCYYSAQLDDFANNLLPKIVENAAECLIQ